jgi:hypothetical protein
MKTLKRTTHRWEDNIGTNVKEIRRGSVDGIRLARAGSSGGLL